ncbi:MAG: hypothetical protein OXU78_07175 [Deltaproteobacteria bacterium]|nr:hypothetical protein [Deltaproteobacteria bacterium]
MSAARGAESVAAQVRGARAGAALCEAPGRALIAVRGGDRRNWLDGMLTRDIANLAAGQAVYALALTRQGRIVSDLFALAFEEHFWLDLPAAAEAETLEHLQRFIVADDVTLESAGANAWQRFTLEGPGAEAALLQSGAAPPAAGRVANCKLAGAQVWLAGYGFTGEPAWQVFAPPGAANAVRAKLCAAAGVVEVSAAALECLRIENGVPRFGAELDGSVLPAEARLERAIATDKGCYTGQEVVARMQSRGRVGHLLVGLRFAPEASADGAALCRNLPDAELRREGAAVGAVTSAALSPQHGVIALGFVRAAHAEPGTALCAAPPPGAAASGGAAAEDGAAAADGAELRAVVAALPFGA